ncbi:restriction endonuclease subunit S [uncultured Cardiobacterium sp.]|uniref:restriction endonuclease subunit S n=1 Tax=uncultured Cardiobacterium sp. TaxID=417619 RepID=UPI00262C7AF7|nr:restriction endonuclease subunit S [uncultured Cardiobacterium sp.]
MNELQDCILGDLVEFQRGYDLPKDSFVKGEYPVQSSNGILGYHNEYKVKAPGITIGRSGTVGIPHLITKNFFPHNTALYVKDFKGNNVHYIYYLLKNLKLNEYKTGSGVPTMNRNHLHPLKIKAFTDSKYQQSIAAVLSALDKKIALNKQINARLEEIAKTLYDYWFVQFDFPDANGKPYKSSGGEMVFDETLKREIPKGWEVKKIESILTIGSGFPFNSKDYTDRGKYQIVTIKNVQDTYLDLTKTDKVGKIPNNIKEFCILKKGDILISLTGNVGRICFVDMNNLLLNQRVGKFICHKEYLYFFYLLFNRSESKERLEKLANGSSQSNLSPIEAVKDLFVCPSNIVLEQFNAKVDLLFEKLLLNQQQNYHLTQLRDFLLPMLMNGQVSVVE